MRHVKVAIVMMFLFGGVIGFAAGYAVGGITMLNWGIDKAIYFLNLKGVELEIDSDEISSGIRQYMGAFNTCYPGMRLENASIFDDKGN